jgi:hypothetical protein
VPDLDRIAATNSWLIEQLFGTGYDPTMWDVLQTHLAHNVPALVDSARHAGEERAAARALAGIPDDTIRSLEVEVEWRRRIAKSWKNAADVLRAERDAALAEYQTLAVRARRIEQQLRAVLVQLDHDQADRASVDEHAADAMQFNPEEKT